MNKANLITLPQPELEAEIYYLTEQEGGRKTAVWNGYRGQFNYNGRDWDAPQQFLDKEICNPGESVKALLQTLSPDFHVGQFFAGHPFETREGGKTIAKGRITKVLRPDFNYWDPLLFLSTIGKDIPPCSESDQLPAFRSHFEHQLAETGFFETVTIVMNGNLECMMSVNCQVAKHNLEPWEVYRKLIECWKSKLTASNQLYKIRFNQSIDIGTGQSATQELALTFATWNSVYLTGQICVS